MSFSSFLTQKKRLPSNAFFFLHFLFFLSMGCLFSDQEEEFFRQTLHTLTIDESPSLLYTATVSSIPIRDKNGTLLASLYYTSYCKEDDALDRAQRPITFCFNGGPGGSSAGLHLGGFGPKRVLTIAEGQSLTAPYQWIDNPFTLLSHTDLVFIDPPGTGCSRASDEIEESYFYDTTIDIQTIGDFIADFLSREGRWKSPKYLAGISYGTYRACGLASYLLGHGIALNGIILLSCAIDLKTLNSYLNEELPFSLSFPSFAAAAWIHGKFPPDYSFSQTIEGARVFALERFAPALFSYGKIPQSFYEEISFWTGLPLHLVERCDGLIDTNTFLLHCCHAQKKVISRYDCRVQGEIPPPRTISEYIDPISQYSSLLAAPFRAYLQEELGCYFEWPRYELFSEEAFRSWSWNQNSMLRSLQKALIVNPELRIFVGSGYFDLCTPFSATEYTFKHLSSFQERITLKNYEGGHAFFSNPQILKQFKNDLSLFYEKH